MRVQLCANRVIELKAGETSICNAELNVELIDALSSERLVSVGDIGSDRPGALNPPVNG